MGYRYLRTIIAPLDEAQLPLDLTCSHCPEWSIRDVLSHLMLVIEPAPDLRPPENYDELVFASLVNADPNAQARPAEVRDSHWNEAVAAVGSVPMADLFERWERSIALLDPTNRPPHGDFAAHLGDLDEALGHDGGRELEVQTTAVKGYSLVSNRQLQVNGRATVSDSTEMFPVYGWLDESRRHDRVI